MGDKSGLLEELGPWIDHGEIKVQAEAEDLFRLLGAMFPIGINRIDWRGVRNHLSFDVFPVTAEVTTGDEKERKLAECREMLMNWFCSNHLDLRQQIVWIGDDSKFSLRMSPDTLLECYPLLFSWPQHSYVMPPTGEWCLNYSMEGQLFFGEAKNAIAHGCVDLDEFAQDL